MLPVWRCLRPVRAYSPPLKASSYISTYISEEHGSSAPSRTGDSRSRGPWGRRTSPTPPSEDYITDETVARAKAIERLRELIGGAYSRRRAPMDVDMPGYSAGPILAGGCLRVVVIIFLMLTLSYCSLSFLGSGLMFYF